MIHTIIIVNKSCIFNRDNQSELCIDRHNIECPLNGSEIEIEHFSAAKRLHHYPFVWYRGGQCEVSSNSTACAALPLR